MKLLIFIVAYNAQKTIKSVLTRIPQSLTKSFDTEVLIIDDASQDSTFLESNASKRELNLPFTVTVLKNPINQGYGGNQKLGYRYAIQFGFDYVALIHGDGQYAPECLPDLLNAFQDESVSAVFGSRMLIGRNAIKGGMPLYKYIGNKILTNAENFLLKSSLSEFHSGYRIYSIKALQSLPFECNTNDFHFDTEIIVQLIANHKKIVELPIPTYYGDEICHVNGIKYAWNVMVTVLRYRAQSLGIFYDRKFDITRDEKPLENYQLKLNDISPHTITADLIKPNSEVLDLGCASGYVGALLQTQKKCVVTGVDRFMDPNQQKLNHFIQHDLFQGPPPIDYKRFDYVLMLDVIEHVPDPENFLIKLHEEMAIVPNAVLLISTGNIAFIVTRIMLLLGQFNYGKRGILDMTHTRLFTFASLRHILEQSGFDVQSECGVPAPINLAIGSGGISRLLLKVNMLFIRLAKRMFSYQIYMIATPRPTVSQLLKNAVQYSEALQSK